MGAITLGGRDSTQKTEYLISGLINNRILRRKRIYRRIREEDATRRSGTKPACKVKAPKSQPTLNGAREGHKRILQLVRCIRRLYNSHARGENLC